jgi:hypothetical protein
MQCKVLIFLMQLLQLLADAARCLQLESWCPDAAATGWTRLALM